MTLDKTRIYIFAAGLILGLLCGFFVGKGIYNQPIEESVTRDTLWLYDTVPDIAPHPKDSIITKWKTKWLPRYSTDTVEKPIYIDNVVHDSVLVQVPITSKHYGGKNYDAWVSGFEPSLDSIFVYNETQIITETITREKKQSPLSLNVGAGAEYFKNGKDLFPFVQGELGCRINDSRFSVGINAGAYKADKVEPFLGGYIKIKVF